MKINNNGHNSDKITVSGDSRITVIGSLLRKFKIDELPQIWNVLKGEMSFVGPRPEVPEFVNLNDPEQKKILTIRPGITDFASIKYIDESSLLAKHNNPTEFYRNTIAPDKIKINMEFVNNYNLYNYFKIIFMTITKIFFYNRGSA